MDTITAFRLVNDQEVGTILVYGGMSWRKVSGRTWEEHTSLGIMGGKISQNHDIVYLLTDSYVGDEGISWWLY